MSGTMEGCKKWGSEAHLTVISYSMGSRAKSECMRVTACRNRRSWGAATRGRLASEGDRGSEQEPYPTPCAQT